MNKTVVAQQAKTESFLPSTHGVLQRKHVSDRYKSSDLEGGKYKENQHNLPEVPSGRALFLPIQSTDTTHKNFLGSRFSHIKSHNNQEGAGECRRLCFQLASSEQSGKSFVAPAIVNDVLRDTGQPLDPHVRAQMESSFNFDFSQVRVHTNSKASESALASNALAYTVNKDVVFGAGRYAPQTTAGKRLLAHELTHVVQQHNASSLSPSTSLLISDADSLAEREADTFANGVVAGNSPLNVTQRVGMQVLSPWRGAFDITTRLPKSRMFSVSSGAVSVECSARFSGPPGGAAACPDSSNFTITLRQDGILFDSNYGAKTYPVPGNATHSWIGLPSGTYYLEVYYPNSNPNCRVLGDLNVIT